MARLRGKIVVFDSKPAPLVTRLVSRGYIVLVAKDLAHLQIVASRERPDLVAGDLTADGTSAVDVCARFKSNLLLRHLPIVVVTHRDDVGSRVAVMNSGADDYVVAPYDREELFARIDRAIARARASLDANPLTRLPGNASIRAEIDERLASGIPFAVLQVDLDNFKAFNDRYGFFRGDEALRVVGDIILEAIDDPGNGPSNDFAGNIGGDDFVVITSIDRAEPVAARICHLVDERMPYLYDDPDRTAGFITSVDRQGLHQQFPMMTVTVAIVTADNRTFRHHTEISEVGSEIKQYLKRLQGSNYLADRRRQVEPLPVALAAVPTALESAPAPAPTGGPI
jgi:diguanylate cyclase (GGDEF)-like protein